MDAYDRLEAWAERAAIMEFDGEMDRETAEIAAAELTFGGTYYSRNDLENHLTNLRHDTRQQRRTTA